MRKIDCEHCAIRTQGVIKDLPVDQLGAFRACGITAIYKRRQVLFHEDTPAGGLYILCHGAVKLYQSDRFGRQRRDEYTVGWRDAVLIGCAQALALMPGTSRSGVTMTMARALGLTREAAARFSFLLAVPGIAMAGGYELLELLGAPDGSVDWSMMSLGLVVSAITGYLCIHWLLKIIGRIGLAPFALYRFALAALIVVVFA